MQWIGALGSCVADLGTCVVVGSFVGFGVGFGGCFGGCFDRSDRSDRLDRSDRSDRFGRFDRFGRLDHFDHFDEYFDDSGIYYFGVVNYSGWIVDCDFAS